MGETEREAEREAAKKEWPRIQYEVAEIERDRDITVALIAAAETISGAQDQKPDEQDIRDEARAFLKAWMERKRPGLGLPRL